MEKTKSSFNIVFFSCGNAFWHFCRMTKLDHTMSLLNWHISSKKNKKTPKTLMSETCIEAQGYCAGKLISLFMSFFLFSFAAKEPCKSCPLYLRLGVHCLTTGWEESMMGKTWWDLTLVRQRRQRERKEGNENEKLQTGRQTKPAGG